MTYGEMKDYVLQLLNAYSVAGEQVALSYNDQADLVARMPHLTRDALHYVTTTVRRLRTVAELTEPKVVGDMLVYDLPEDFYQLVGGLVRLVGRGQGSRYRGYRLVGGRQIQIPRSDAGRYQVEYFRYPTVPDEAPEADLELDCPPEACSAVACYVAAHLAMEDNNYIHGALYNEFERKLLRLQEGQRLDLGVTEDAYSEL